MNPALWLYRAALRWPTAPALLLGERVLADYAAFDDAAARLGRVMRDRFSIQPGDRVALFLKNCPDYLIILYATWYAGGAVVPINAKLHSKEAAWIIHNAEARLAFTGPEVADALQRDCTDLGATPAMVTVDLHGGLLVADGTERLTRPLGRAPDDLAWLFYTSGTTGRPKGVMMSGGNLQAMTNAYFTDVDTVRAEDAIVYAAPMSHGAGIYNFMHVIRGARHVVPDSGGFDAAEILTIAPRLDSVHLFAAPTMVARLVVEARRLGLSGDGLRTIVYGGGPMYLADITAALDTFGPRFVQIYGQGECPMCITVLPRDILRERADPCWAARAASVGLPQSCTDIRIVDEAGEELPPGRSGEILVRGTPVMLGYWRDPEATAATIRDGWLHTGDVGSLDADGYLVLKDRCKDVIISGGTNIYPREVEEALLTHPDVVEVSVIGAPDPEWGENVVAFVVSRQGTAPMVAALDAHCLASIARFKRPKEYRFVTELPKNNYGKVLKTELRARLPLT